MTTHNVPVHRCINCGEVQEAATGINVEDAPGEGDVSICFKCGHIAIFNANMQLRNPTDAEMYELAGDKNIIDAQAALAMMKRLKGKKVH
jgi:hypothetical protein